MTTPNFRDMSPEEFKAFRPRTEDEEVACEKESHLRDWCEEMEEDPQDESARNSYNEIQEETGQKFWDGLDENDRAGWEDNIIKSGED